jgi:hypothetical protein
MFQMSGSLDQLSKQRWREQERSAVSVVKADGHRGRYRCRYGGARHRDLMVNLLGISAEQRVFELTPLV